MVVTVNAAIIDEKDTVVVAIEKINAGDEVIWRDRNGDVQKIKAITDVPMYHKVAIKEMPKGTEVVKYGEHIGPVSYTHLRAHETRHDLVCRLLLEKKKNKRLGKNSYA